MQQDFMNEVRELTEAELTNIQGGASAPGMANMTPNVPGVANSAVPSAPGAPSAQANSAMPNLSGLANSAMPNLSGLPGMPNLSALLGPFGGLF